MTCVLASCRVTDHSETDEISTRDLAIPSSGYRTMDPKELAHMRFDSTGWNMGKVAEGAQVENTYSFINDGKRDLIITDVRGSCGCTVGKDWPRQPVPPGTRGAITVAFDTEGRPGRQHKTITVVANTDPATTVLTLSGEVVAAPDPN